MGEYPDYKPEDIYEDLKKVLPEESLSKSIFERKNNPVAAKKCPIWW